MLQKKNEIIFLHYFQFDLIIWKKNFVDEIKFSHYFHYKSHYYF